MSKQPRNTLEVQHIQLEGRRYVILAESVFHRLCAAAGAEEGQPLPPDVSGQALTPLAWDGRSLARRLVERRQAAGLTQAELARRSGIRVETLNRIERGKTTPDFATVRKLLTVLSGPPSSTTRADASVAASR